MGLQDKARPEWQHPEFKARLIVKGCSQLAGVDCNEKYAPITSIAAFWSLPTIASSNGLHLCHFDVGKAFLYGTCDEALFMEQPDCLSDGTDKVYQLKKSLHGLKKAPRVWYLTLKASVECLGFKSTVAERFCLKGGPRSNGDLCIILWYIDDIIASWSRQKSQMES